MLASLLPGLRELRTPLAAGYTWLLGLWLAFHPLFPPHDQATGVYRDVVSLADWAGKPATFAAVSFAAYVVGILSLAATNVLDIVLSRSLRAMRLARFAPWKRRDTQVRKSLEEAVQKKLSKRFLADHAFRQEVVQKISDTQVRASQEGKYFIYSSFFEDIPDLEPEAVRDSFVRETMLDAVVDSYDYVEEVESDLRYVAPRLLGRDDQVYGEYDRLKTEAEFRLGMVLPIIALLAVLAIRQSPWWAFGVAIPVTLMYLGIESQTSSDLTLAVALAAERVENPALERLMTIDVEFEKYQDLVRDASPEST